MKLIGFALLFFGLGPVMADYLGHEVVAFAWIDRWGPETGLAIKAAMIAFGAAFFLPGGRRSRRQKPRPQPNPAWFPARNDTGYPDPVAGLYNRRRN